LKAIPVLVLGLIILSCTYPPASASKLSIQLQDRTAQVVIASSIHQNFTSLKDRAIDLKGRDLSITEEALKKGLKARLSSISVSDVAAKIAVSETNLNVTISFNAQNISSISGRVISVDCAWKSFNVPDDLMIEDVSYNLVGKVYVKPVLFSYANSSWARFYLNDNPVFYQDAADAAGNATLLDFRAVSKPLDSWNRTIDMAKQKTIWYFPSEKAFDLRVSVQEPNRTIAYYSTIQVASEIVAPLFATVDGDTVVSNESGGVEEQLMFLAVMLVVAISLGVHIYERKIAKRLQRPRR
jgi:hypothetical protein